VSAVNQLLKEGMKHASMAPKMGPVERIKALMRAPSVGRLVWVLYQDPRVPIKLKGGALTALAVVVSPVDFMRRVPLVGELSDIVLAMFVLDTFIRLAPAEVVNEHIRRLNLQDKIPIRG
jgi:uncharacterized membrane protein YkvA (DUF1232 family)